MISLARENLIHDWRRHSTAIFVLVLAGLLMTIQLGFVIGYTSSFGELKSQVRADIVITPKGGQGYRSMDSRHEGSLWMHPEVEMVLGWSNRGESAQWQAVEDISNDSSNKHLSTTRVQLNAVDPSAQSMSFPKQFPEIFRAILATPATVILPKVSAKVLGVTIGDKALIGGVEVIVGAIFDGLPGSYSPRVFVSIQTMRLLSGPGNRVSSYLIKVKDPTKIKQTIHQLNLTLKQKNMLASTVEDFSSNDSFSEILKGPGKILLGSAAFALIVGCGIASQTLRGAFLAQIKEFGSLRALGIRKRVLAAIAMEQSFWIGVISIPISFIAAHTIRIISGAFDIVINLPLYLMGATSGLLMAVALFAGLFSLTVVFKAEPAELLR